jgi:peptidoglycan/LPS O-acetylase OafA/YrhL
MFPQREDEHILFQKKQIYYIDGLRGLAALWAMNYHWFEQIFPKLNDKHHLIVFLTSHGKLAVAVFFLLSGRVIAHSILRTPTVRNVFDTTVRRMFRIIVPVIWIWMYLFVMQRLGSYNFELTEPSKHLVAKKFYNFYRHPISFWEIFTRTWDIFVKARVLDGDKQLHGFHHGWTLIVEIDSSIHLYLIAFILGISYFLLYLYIGNVHRYLRPIFYLVFLLLSFFSRNLTLLFIFGLLISDLSSNNVFSWIQKRRWVNYPLQTFFVLYILGMAGGYLADTGHALDKWYYSVSKTAVPGEFLYLFATRVGVSRRDGDFVRLTSSICILLLLELNLRLQRVFSSDFFRLLGKYSFGFYLLHIFVEAGPGILIKQSLEGLGVGRDVILVRGILTYAGMILWMAPFCWLFLKTADGAGVWAGRYANRLNARYLEFVGGWEIFGRIVVAIRSKFPRFGIVYQKLESTTE